MKKPAGFVMAVVCAMAVVSLFAGCSKKEQAPKAVENVQIEQLLTEGTGFLKQGEVVKAVQNFAAAIQQAPDNFEGYFMLAQTFIHLKQYAQAQAVLTAAAKRFPQNPVVFYLLSLSYQGSDDLMPAIVAARRSVDLFQASKDLDGEKRATVLLGVLVQMGKQQAEQNMVKNAAEEAQKVQPPAMPKVH